MAHTKPWASETGETLGARGGGVSFCVFQCLPSGKGAKQSQPENSSPVGQSSADSLGSCLQEQREEEEW